MWLDCRRDVREHARESGWCLTCQEHVVGESEVCHARAGRVAQLNSASLALPLRYKRSHDEFYRSALMRGGRHEGKAEIRE